MTSMALAFGALVVLLVLIAVRVPIAFAMGLVGTIGMALHQGMAPALSLVGQVIGEVGTSSTLALLPLFVLMGNFVTRAGLSRDLYTAADALIGSRRGGLAMATVMACGGFSAICGSSLATAATMCKVAMPQMRAYNYKNPLAAGSIAAGGTLGILIPPSIILVFYGTITETSIGKLFFAALVPGILGLLLYLVAVWVVTLRDPDSGPPGPSRPWSERLRSLWGVSGVVVLFLTVMGGIYAGVFTPTESASIGAAGAFLLAWKRGALSWRALRDVILETTNVSAMMFVILMGALVFANFINNVGMPQEMATLVSSMGSEPIVVLLMILAVYIVLGCFLESISMLLLTVPIFFPIVVALGFDPIWFGIVVVVVIEIGLITPPIGLNLFVIKSVMPDVPTTDIVRGVVPFIAADVLRLALLVALPSLTLFLPSLM